MKDAIGQEINVGDTVVACGGTYADAQIYNVKKITKVNCSLDRVRTEGSGRTFSASRHPDTLVVGAGNLAGLGGSLTFVEAANLASLVEDSNFLDRLKGAGVDNWEGYEFAFGDD